MADQYMEKFYYSNQVEKQSFEKDNFGINKRHFLKPQGLPIEVDNLC